MSVCLSLSVPKDLALLYNVTHRRSWELGKVNVYFVGGYYQPYKRNRRPKKTPLLKFFYLIFLKAKLFYNQGRSVRIQKKIGGGLPTPLLKCASVQYKDFLQKCLNIFLKPYSLSLVNKYTQLLQLEFSIYLVLWNKGKISPSPLFFLKKVYVIFFFRWEGAFT